MAIAPLAARRIRHRGLFGLAIVAAGLALVAVALAPHLIAALAAVILVGCAGGVAFLTGLTIIGAQVADEMRGRTIAFVQSLVRLDLLASMALVPFAVGLVQQRTVTLFSERVTIDGTRPVLLCAGLLAAMVGVVAHRLGRIRRPRRLGRIRRPRRLGRIRRPRRLGRIRRPRRDRNERVGRPGRAGASGGHPGRGRRTGWGDDPRLAVHWSAWQRPFGRGPGFRRRAAVH
jgi:dTMP kinase